MLHHPCVVSRKLSDVNEYVHVRVIDAYSMYVYICVCVCELGNWLVVRGWIVVQHNAVDLLHRTQDSETNAVAMAGAGVYRPYVQTAS